MKKCLFIFLFLLSAATVWAQKKPALQKAPVIKKTSPGVKKTSLVNLISSQDALQQRVNGKDVIVVHKGTFKQDYSTLTSDSAYFYPDKNAVDAFGHVIIDQGDTLHIFSDKLHYEGNTKQADLNDHVKMIDKDATLTTNNFTYNTATRIGIYTDGGKLVNKDNTIVSKNGYYFAFTRDAYFRYDVVGNTPDAIIKTDTLRYNSKTRISYFYGPTHIYGKKDKDTLYTENGTYNNNTEQAAFGKNNLYSQGTKTLKGDSLFYDRLKGYGRAVKNMTFNDTEQKTTLKGDLGEYYKADDRAVATRNAYMIIVTEEKDSTQTDSAKAIKTATKVATSKGVTTRTTDSTTLKRLGLNKPSPINGGKALTDSTTIKRLGLAPAPKATKDTASVKPPAPKNSKPVTAAPPATAIKGNTTPANNKTTNPPAKGKTAAVAAGKTTANSVKTPKAADDHIKRDSIFIGGDTLETRIVTYKELKELKKLRWEAGHPDTSVKVIHTEMLTKPPKVLTAVSAKILPDTGHSHQYFFGRPKPKTAPKKAAAKPVDLKKAHLDSVKNARIADSLQKVADHGLVDTSRIRIISAHHHSKLFKSDLQAKADSMFYAYSDSTIRMYVNPIIWTQGSQLTGDTIHLQLKNRKLDNMDLYHPAFIANIEKNDSTHFNQVSGKTMHGTFVDNKLHSMFVNGNSEIIAFKRDSVTNKVTDMNHSMSARSYAYFENGDVHVGALIVKSESTQTPIAKVKEEEKLLKNFIWKPKERPKSRKDVLVPYKPPVKAKANKKDTSPPKGTMPIKSSAKAADKKTDSAEPEKVPPPKAEKDTVIRPKPDTLKKVVDTAKKVPVVLKPGQANN